MMTEEQIKNFRVALFPLLGLYVFFMSKEDIIKYRDKLQSKLDTLAKLEKELGEEGIEKLTRPFTKPNTEKISFYEKPISAIKAAFKKAKNENQ
jgi:hypothetical protein